MSRIAKKPIIIPPKTEASFSGGVMTIKGPLGVLSKTFRPYINVVVENRAITLTPNGTSLQARALWGTYASHIKNMLIGVNKPYEKRLVVEGIGFKADVKGTNLVLVVGFSHPVNVPIPTDLKVTTEKNIVVISGMDCESVGQFAAVVRAMKKPEPYLGKGIRYSDEVIRRKQGKKAA
ncbi:MAG: 50S ribosomal protein L6 [Candidatus Taylorbacteria bacterium RIFCSPHIGHO2_02_FULL_45_28]|uniref:50S ribosomal protein L6 n=1 Tax=Candidatus Taylorbacteria bacterium RIFCSPHIGHO2_12_FULL_45_16 TaxID=1802315 RepID=A0A1G2MZ11_9BACT|nr:MAG: 50S ribosomal protein L6 [Candidatus Taylorbacteria bacterium RIFCSPHIGHO2_01_FULL_44_110]OHA25452.1 MAG: 50S ribosomal protein L6 [Candidatus Taylorbacteria bacterium RIFCSPHIGHO2_02_FULL_45_28]OHA29120.1 MAG: 50S ribosomal protein L6 [Candidatus Taylorbacteria bacterium RIFCSPHIGHO2_12_FULL_45_16]OHA33342.1 MAG: 50S ribosomal protein L6 [Candidatus Taylorbacteria bacterium RIFCSPLOWO2_01_FULL_45_59]OHA44654.1 MAG: 50S ribosomal protein L6 [Candidatus Taylorbacteria bacterium RIFCSPLOW